MLNVVSKVVALKVNKQKIINIFVYLIGIVAISGFSSISHASPPEQAQLYKDVATGTIPQSGLSAEGLYVVDDLIYMSTTGNEPGLVSQYDFDDRDSSIYGDELHVYDTQQQTLTRVIDLWPGRNSSYPTQFNWLNGSLYFVASAPDAEGHLFRYDPQTGQTVMVFALSDIDAFYIEELVTFDSKLYFTARAASSNYTGNVYVYDPAQPTQTPDQLTNYTALSVRALRTTDTH